ncbi:MAG: glycosyl hydrolase-related protein [candidate division KSB1 bacterium]|nr:glycosyl hydrolase-related protein [candidate division KSB1 bacterium]MDZ7300937.1 glycosyl hydrolase-related protein [candidate division KSB1 bacterium]MDZ7310384.1 glycosyl hydrolase-related protein [candidate division KSB1 bacterium]
MTPTYHIVSHTHWDREWYLSFEQFRAMLVRMVDDLLDLLACDPEYKCFTLDGQTIVLEDYLTIKPERADEIRRLVAEGRLLIGPWYILPDEFLVSGEATIRNLLFGRRLSQQFGTEMKVGYIPDSFGHIAMMPAILRGFDIDSAVLYRGFGGEPEQKTSEYCWQAPDGSRCLMIHLFRHGYSAGYFHQETPEQILQRFAEIKNELDSRATTSQRLLMNGGDHHWPDPKLPQTLDLLRKNFAGNFVHSNLPAYLEAVKKEVNGLPEVAGELRFGYRYAFAVLGGVYSSRMYLKQENWKCQTLLERYVEPLNVFAITKGMRSQTPPIRQAWKNLLQNHPHDSICSCSIDSVHREMMTRFKAVKEIGGAVIETCLNHLIPYDDLAYRDDRYVFFFNPSPFARSEVAEAQINFYLQDIVVGLNPEVKVAPKLPPISGFVLLDGEGKEVPYQLLWRAEGYDITYSQYNYPKQSYAEKFSVLVDIRDVPAVGFKGLVIKKTDRFPKYASNLKTGRNFIENDYLRVEVNAHGEVTLKDKTNGCKYTRLNVFEDSGDVGDEYNYSYPPKDQWLYSNKGKARIKLVEKGPLRAALQVNLMMRIPEAATADKQARSAKHVKIPITTTLYLTPYSRAVEIETTVGNNAKDHRFRVLFPSGIKTDRVYADSQFCVVERQQKEYDLKKFTIEHPAKVAPMQRFVTVKDDDQALTLLSYGLPEYELKLDGKGTIALTLLRCVGLLAGENLITRPGGKAGWHNETPEAQCLGPYTFRYAIFPHRAEEFATMESLNEQCEKFHYPLLAVRRKNTGELQLKESLLTLSPKTLVLSAIKESEDAQAAIVRWWNPMHQEVPTELSLHLPVKKITLAKLNEEPTNALSSQQNHKITTGACGITTVHIEF